MSPSQRSCHALRVASGSAPSGSTVLLGSAVFSGGRPPGGVPDREKSIDFRRNAPIVSNHMGVWLSWIERRPPEPKATGSNPVLRTTSWPPPVRVFGLCTEAAFFVLRASCTKPAPNGRLASSSKNRRRLISRSRKPPVRWAERSVRTRFRQGRCWRPSSCGQTSALGERAIASLSSAYSWRADFCGQRSANTADVA